MSHEALPVGTASAIQTVACRLRQDTSGGWRHRNSETSQFEKIAVGQYAAGEETSCSRTNRRRQERMSITQALTADDTDLAVRGLGWRDRRLDR